MLLSKITQRKWWRIVRMAWEQSQHNALTTNVAALTYSTVLASVPVLALLLAITRGFNLEQYIETQLRLHLNVQEEVINILMQFANSYLDRSNGGVIVGVSVAMLFFTLISLVVNIEEKFNAMWGVDTSRNVFRITLPYLGLLVFSIIVIVLLSGIWISVQQLFKLLPSDTFFSATTLLLKFCLKWVLTSGVLIVMFKFIPHTMVKWRSTFFPAFLSGFLFCLVQEFYVYGQIFLSSYDAIYGSFAVLPLMMISFYVTWAILLMGVQLCQVVQHVRLLGDDLPTLATDRHSRDVIALWLTRHAAQRFVADLPSCSLNDFSTASRLSPVHLERELHRLVAAGIFFKYQPELEEEPFYKINTDVHQLTVRRLFERLDHEGQAYVFPTTGEGEWSKLATLRTHFSDHSDWNQLVKDV